MNEALLEALANGGGAITPARQPRLARRIRTAVTRGQLVALLPGAYVRPETTADFLVRAHAVCAADPDAVITGPAAAHLSGWAEFEAPAVVTAASTRLRDRPGFRFEDRSVPRKLTRTERGIRFTSRALTVLDLLPEAGAAAIDDALRRHISLDSLWRALDLTPGRRGNVLRRRLLTESRAEAWSEAERVAHAALHAAGMHSWVANHEVGLTQTWRVHLDVAFRGARLALEIDGRAHHEGWAKQVGAYRRDRALAQLGWLVGRFSAAEVLADPAAFAAEVAALLAARLESLAGRGY